jgi:exosortase/archaeosortase family protein
MQFWTADFAGALLNMMGASAFVTGDLILREGNSFAIIETCSGVRITETLTMLTILMLDLFRRRPVHSAILLAMAPVVAFFCNGLRAVTLILNPHSDITEIHTLQGVGMLLGGLLVLYGIDGVLGKLFPRGPEVNAQIMETASKPNRAQRSEIASLARWRSRGVAAAFAGFAAIALALPPWTELTGETAAVHYMVPFADTEMAEVGAWSSVLVPVDRRFNGRVGLQRDVSRRYFLDGDSVRLYAAAGERGFRSNSVLFSKVTLPGSGWNTYESGEMELDPGGIEATWRVAVSGTRRYFVVSWQENAGGVWEESLRSLLGLDLSPFRRPGEAIVVRLATDLPGMDPSDRAIAAARLWKFYRDLRPELDAQHAILRGDTI